MILNHVAQGAGLFVISAAAFDADGLGGRDLHEIHVTSIPQRLEDAIPETESQDVLYCLFTQVVIDSVDGVFVKDFVDGGVKRPRTGQIAAERLFHYQPPPAAGGGVLQSRAAEAFDHRFRWLGCVDG